jgi:hypothetical protein
MVNNDHPQQRRIRCRGASGRWTASSSYGWIDAESQALLDSLVESLPTAHLLLLVSYRPEYQQAWSSKNYYRQLSLDPLPPESAEALLEALLGNDASLHGLKKQLIERTDRNPFFIEESVRTLVETKTLTGERGAYRQTKPLHNLLIPATAQAILAARIDRLPADDKRVLQAASVIGNDVPFALLPGIVDEADDHLGLGKLYWRTAKGAEAEAELVIATKLYGEMGMPFWLERAEAEIRKLG